MNWLRTPLALLTAVVGLSVAALPMSGPASGASRIKDIADFEGIRDNLLVGYGLVVGLSGSGDNLNDDVFTRNSLIGMLERLGVGLDRATVELDSENVAAVMVTATLPPFSRHGSRIDVTVSALGTAESLLGGTLVVTPLLGADGEVYAVAQGQLAVGGFAAGGAGQTVQKGVPTSGRIANGAILEREVGFELAELSSINVALRNPDFTTARRIQDAINSFLGGPPAARMRDPGTVSLTVPETYRGDVAGLLTDIEQLRIEPDQIAKVIVDEQSGAIVVGENVRISTVAVALETLTIRVTETPQVSQPNPFTTGTGASTSTSVGEGSFQDSDGDGVVDTFVPGDATSTATGAGGASTVVVDRTDVAVESGGTKKFEILDDGVSLADLVKGLNGIGISPRDMITILQSIKAAGALQAELEFL